MCVAAGLRKVKGQLLQTLAQCEQPPCVRLKEKYKIGQLDTEIQYNQVHQAQPRRSQPSPECRRP